MGRAIRANPIGSGRSALPECPPVLLDARTVEPGTTLDADVCVVGAGAAGITIARALAATSRSVLLLESGGFGNTADTHRLTEGEVVGRTYRPLSMTRIRAFGGTTGHWNGLCRPLDPIDFEARPDVPETGWPFGLDELEPWYALAHEVLELGPVEYDTAWWRAVDDPGEELPFPPESPLETVMWQFSSPTRFGVVYREELVGAPRITVCLNANVVNIATTPDAARVTALDVATLTGRRFRARARLVVIAAGALENARLLLSSTDDRPEGLGNDHGLVGRYFCDHPHVTAGPVVLARPLDALGLYAIRPGPPSPDGLPDGRPLAVWASLALTEAARRGEGLLGFSATMHPPGPLPIDGFDSLARLAADTAPLVGDVRSAPGTPQATVSTLYLRCEQAPNPDSRVRLGEKRDALGLRMTRLDWRLTDIDHQSAARAVALLSAELGRLGLGAARVEPPEDRLFDPALGGPHQLGTLRMSVDASRGVVDADCRVHGMENLFVAGAAVFPTSGYANPTLTIVALALRLAAKLQQELT
jgi:choline dehydrogenase-like flavoprotein